MDPRQCFNFYLMQTLKLPSASLCYVTMCLIRLIVWRTCKWLEGLWIRIDEARAK